MVITSYLRLSSAIAGTRTPPPACPGQEREGRGDLIGLAASASNVGVEVRDTVLLLNEPGESQLIEFLDGDMLAHLAVDDARTAQDAGAKFARILAGIGSVDFMVALAEQGDLIRRAITDAGFSAEQARLAAEHFEVAARDEWTRVADASGTTADGWV